MLLATLGKGLGYASQSGEGCVSRNIGILICYKNGLTKEIFTNNMIKKYTITRNNSKK